MSLHITDPEFETMARTECNKGFVRKVKRTRPDLKVSQIYELLSTKLGFKDWNTASAAGVVFRKSFCCASCLNIK